MAPFDIAGWYTKAINYHDERWRSPNFWPVAQERRAVVLHVTDGVDSRGWLCNPASQVSSHFLLREEGIYQHVSLQHSAWANGIWDEGHTWHGVLDTGNPNRYTISIEREGKPNKPLSEAIEYYTILVLRDLASVYPRFIPYVPHLNLIGHYEISPRHRPNCPGPLVDFARIAAHANAAILAPSTPFRAYNADSAILGAPHATPGQATAYILARPHDNYADVDIADVIVPGYYTTCRAVGVDAVLALAQMIHETGNLTSWWSARGTLHQAKRRNPAGIGVTGHSQRFKPANARDWAYNQHTKLWHAGESFATWKDDAIPAHVGRLLAYALPAGSGTFAQRALIEKALNYRPLPPACRGSAPTILLLGSGPNAVEGCGWAGKDETEGMGYGAKLAEIANAICMVPL